MIINIKQLITINLDFSIRIYVLLIIYILIDLSIILKMLQESLSELEIFDKDKEMYEAKKFLCLKCAHSFDSLGY